MNKHGLSDDWEEMGKNPIWELDDTKVGEKFFGVYLDKEENLGPNSSTLYNFIRYEDEKFTQRIGGYSIWGASLLDTRFKNFVRSEQVAIIFFMVGAYIIRIVEVNCTVSILPSFVSIFVSYTSFFGSNKFP